MSSSAVTRYIFSFGTLHGNEPSETIAGEFTSASGMNDEVMIAFARAFRDLPWPAGINTDISVTKQSISTDSTMADLDSGTYS